MTYQSFSGNKGDSDSYEKLTKLKLPKLAGKRFLDIGCNEGYFCGVAIAAGAQEVMGIDINKEIVSAAQKRFPSANFKNLSWNDNLSGRYDVIICLSAIHYSEDQPKTIAKILELLSDDGVFILELGLVDTDSFEYQPFERAAGDVRYYATFKALDDIFGSNYVYKVIGPSVNQSGDPVPRWVVHVFRRKPTIMLFMTQSFSGKSSVSALISKRRDMDVGFKLISFDELIVGLDSYYDSYVKQYPVLERFKRFVSEHEGSANYIMDDLGKYDYLFEFIKFVVESSLKGKELVVWDGYVPEHLRSKVSSSFEVLGYNVWVSSPVVEFSKPVLDINAIWLP